MPNDSGMQSGIIDMAIHIAQVIWTGLSFLVIWIWRQIRRNSTEIDNTNKKIQDVELSRLQDQVSLHKHFVTRSEIRTIVHEAIDPVRESIVHMEKTLDVLSRLHMNDDGK